MITLFLEALSFTTYLSLYLHRIFKFYFFLLLTFIFSFWLSNYQNIEIYSKILPSLKKSKILIILLVFAAQNLTIS